MCPSYPTSASGRTLAKPSGIIGIGYRNHSRTYTVRQYPKTNHSTEFQWKISNNSVTKCKEAIFSFLQCRAWFWFSHNIFERTESAYSRVGHVNYGQLGNRLANLWINGPLGLGYRAGARLSYPARHTPLSPTYHTNWPARRTTGLAVGMLRIRVANWSLSVGKLLALTYVQIFGQPYSHFTCLIIQNGWSLFLLFHLLHRWRSSYIDRFMIFTFQ